MSGNGVHPFAPGTDVDTPAVDREEHSVGADPFAAASTSGLAYATLPHSLDAEQAVLGGIMLRNELIREIDLEPADFYDPRHQAVWSALAELEEERRPLDEVTVAAQLQTMAKLEAVGGRPYVDQLGLRVPTAENAIHYAGIVADLAAKRRAALALSQLAARAYDPDLTGEELLGLAQARLSEIHPRTSVASGELYGSDLRQFLGDDEPDDDPSLDYIIHGLVPRAAPFVIGGHPKQGKTLLVEDLAISIASGAADWCGFPISEDMRGGRVLLMPREDTARETRVRLWRLARGRGLDPRELAGRLEVDPVSVLYLDDAELVAKLRRSTEAFDLVLIDSLQTVHRGDENSARDMAIVCGAWRDVALTTGKAVGLIHHFNGKGAEGDARDPGHKLRGSSAIFATARHVVGIERLRKPESAVAVRVSGNLSHIPEPFAVRRVETRLATGKVAWGYEPLGVLGQMRDPEVGDAVIAAITKAMPEGLGSRDLRDQVREQVDASNAAIDREAVLLSREGRISRAGKRSPWRLSGQ
jgi:replicative DNA helicase